MGESTEEKAHDIEELVQLTVDRVADLYGAHRLCCSESVIVTINGGFRGNLPQEAALQLGSGLCNGMGGAGCTCGALSGAVAVLGICAGPHSQTGLRKKKFRLLVKEMHDRFRERFNATCCRVLSKKVKHDSKAHHDNCLQLTKGSAEIAIRLLMEMCPELIEKADKTFLLSRNKPGNA